MEFIFLYFSNVADIFLRIFQLFLYGDPTNLFWYGILGFGCYLFYKHDNQSKKVLKSLVLTFLIIYVGWIFLGSLLLVGNDYKTNKNKRLQQTENVVDKPLVQ